MIVTVTSTASEKPGSIDGNPLEKEMAARDTAATRKDPPATCAAGTCRRSIFAPAEYIAWAIAPARASGNHIMHHVTREGIVYPGSNLTGFL